MIAYNNMNGLLHRLLKIFVKCDQTKQLIRSDSVSKFSRMTNFGYIC